MKFFFRRNKRNPIIVVDLTSVIKDVPIYSKNAVEILYGGREENLKQLDKFKRLKEVAELVFFRDGPVATGKSDTWIQRQNENYKNSLEIIDKVHVGMAIGSIVKTIDHGIPTGDGHREIIKSKAKEYGKVITAVSKGCDTEMARYARNNLAFAVISDNSDFLIFEGNWRFWSLEKLNAERVLQRWSSAELF